ncbi:MAG TPA: hypothetical protein VFP50_00995 [Anaeromyxobacteraceae bacterium]|nr:hypothetical protein [Anaeromyxobacteraceae bacterium]
MRRSGFVVLVLALGGCANVFAGKVPPATRRADPNRLEAILAASVAVLQDRGFKVDVRDQARGVVRTEPAVQPGRTPCGFVTCRFRDTVEVSVFSDGTVSVHVLREIDSGGPIMAGVVPMWVNRWDAPPAWHKETMAGAEAAERELLEEILQ